MVFIYSVLKVRIIVAKFVGPVVLSTLVLQLPLVLQEGQRCFKYRFLCTVLNLQ